MAALRATVKLVSATILLLIATGTEQQARREHGCPMPASFGPHGGAWHE